MNFIAFITLAFLWVFAVTPYCAGSPSSSGSSSSSAGSTSSSVGSLSPSAGSISPSAGSLSPSSEALSPAQGSISPAKESLPPSNESISPSSEKKEKIEDDEEEEEAEKVEVPTSLVPKLISPAKKSLPPSKEFISPSSGKKEKIEEEEEEEAEKDEVPTSLVPRLISPAKKSLPPSKKSISPSDKKKEKIEEDEEEEEEEVEKDEVPTSLVPKKSWINDFDARLALARVYSYQKSSLNLALVQYKILLRNEPRNPILLFEAGRVHLSLKEFKEALVLLYAALEIKANSSKVLIAAAQAEGGLGHAEKSNHLMQKILSLKKPGCTSQKTLINYADLMVMWGDFYKAENIYRQALEQKPNSLDLSLKLAWTLTSEQRYEEAEKLYIELLISHPGKPKILKALAALKNLAKDFNSSLEYIEQLITFAPKPANFLLKAETLYLQGSYEEALDVYWGLKTKRNLGVTCKPKNSALQKTYKKYSIKAYVGLGKSYLKLNRYEESEQAFEKAIQLDPENIPAKYYLAVLQCNGEEFCLDQMIEGKDSIKKLEELASVYLENGQSKAPKKIFTIISELDEAYFPAKINLAEMQSINFEFDAALCIYLSLLEIFPENSKITMSIARVYSWSKLYDTSLEWYDELIALNPFNPIPMREKARVAIWGKIFDLSMTTYDRVLSLADQLGIYTLYRTVELEKEEKKLSWNKRYRHSFPVLEELLELTPGNEEALFDKAQNFCSIGRCDYAREVYQHILDIDANHNLVKLALERNLILLNTGLRSNFVYWRELGSGTFSQSQIARYLLNVSTEQPLSCSSRVRFSQDQYVENTFYDRKFHLAEGQTIEGECLFNNFVSGSAGATYKNYFGKFKSRFTGHVMVNINGNDYFNVNLSVLRENEVSNFFSIKQGIQYVASTILFNSDITKFWYIEGSFRHFDFNDGNSREHCMIMTSYAFTDTPNVYKIILKGNYLDTAHQTIPIFIGPKLVDVIHPYWTPNKYFEGSITFQYRHDYRFFEYCEAPERHFDIKITAGQDNTNNPSIEFVIEWKHDFERHWGIEIKGLIHRSPQWKAEGVWASLSYRF